MSVHSTDILNLEPESMNESDTSESNDRTRPHHVDHNCRSQWITILNWLILFGRDNKIQFNYDWWNVLSSSHTHTHLFLRPMPNLDRPSPSVPCLLLQSRSNWNPLHWLNYISKRNQHHMLEWNWIYSKRDAGLLRYSISLYSKSLSP